ncbi:MAG: GNAT family N-acetyltransferase [Firmicutes bacterium]|nr:GNAT family N-acetyltransferase [Bacillota bacterium]
MKEVKIRRAGENDIPVIDKLLFEVHKVHSDVRPDLFKPGAKKYTDEQLKKIIADDKTPVFVAELGVTVVGYAFCIHKQFINDNNMTDVKSLYIDDLCVDESVRGEHIGKQLYEYVLDFAKQNGYYNVTLNVWSDNVNAVKFYEKIGMQIQKIGMEKIL